MAQTTVRALWRYGCDDQRYITVFYHQGASGLSHPSDYYWPLWYHYVKDTRGEVPSPSGIPCVPTWRH